MLENSQSHILIIDDDDRIRKLLATFLERKGYRVTACASGAHARRVMTGVAFDLLILDIMMPEETGLEFLATLRKTDKNTPAIFLSARGETDHRIEGLKLGADDYISKPFEPEELALRVGAILRRSFDAPAPLDLTFSGLVFNIERAELKRGETHIRLTQSERDLLLALAQSPGEALSREDLAERAHVQFTRSIDVQVTRLRKKIEPDPKAPIHLQTVRGVGYRLMPD